MDYFGFIGDEYFSQTGNKKRYGIYKYGKIYSEKTDKQASYRRSHDLPQKSNHFHIRHPLLVAILIEYGRYHGIYRRAEKQIHRIKQKAYCVYDIIVCFIYAHQPCQHSNQCSTNKVATDHYMFFIPAFYERAHESSEKQRWQTRKYKYQKQCCIIAQFRNKIPRQGHQI